MTAVAMTPIARAASIAASMSRWPPSGARALNGVPIARASAGGAVPPAVMTAYSSPSARLGVGAGSAPEERPDQSAHTGDIAPVALAPVVRYGERRHAPVATPAYRPVTRGRFIGFFARHTLHIGPDGRLLPAPMIAGKPAMLRRRSHHAQYTDFPWCRRVRHTNITDLRPKPLGQRRRDCGPKSWPRKARRRPV